MCQLCGCSHYLNQGKEAVTRRVVEVVKELGLTVHNADDYEATEIISGLIAPFGSRDDEIYQTAGWISGLHTDTPSSRREVQYQAHVKAWRDIFDRLPAQGHPRDVATTYHQLEQLARELDEVALAPLDPETQEAIKAVNRVHDDQAAKTAKLKARHGL